MVVYCLSEKVTVNVDALRAVLRSTCLLLLLAVAACGSGAPGEGASNAATPTAAMPFSENSRVYEIVPQESEARFLIDEIFNGEEKMVVGTTGDISGQIAVDLQDPSTAAAGPIRVNANSLVTDNGFRDRAIRNRILLAGIYEYVTFTPREISGMPQEVGLGEEIMFEISGDLTITNISKPVTFVVQAVPMSEATLEGSATATITRNDFDLVVPSATGVAAVAEDVIIELDFVAKATN